MGATFLKLPSISAVKKHEIKTIFVIAICWTIIDYFLFEYRRAIGSLSQKYYSSDINLLKEILLREVNVFMISLILGYFLIRSKQYLRNSSLWFNLFIKTLILVVFGFVMNFFIYTTYESLIAGNSWQTGVEKFIHNMFYTKWLVTKMPEWVVLFMLTLLALEVDEKYSRGVFFGIMMGRYLQPKEEKRIILFLDLKDSTPIAQKLGHKEYFKFIRDFINQISAGLLEHDARIYQYVGDEIVAWWPEKKIYARKVIPSLLSARKELNKNAEWFRRKYGIIPEYKAGIHVGVVTVGQIGIQKKDLVMSGDAINTAARIRTACSELNQKYLVSKEMVELLELKDFQTESIGKVDLKGKNHEMELFALKI